MAKGDGPLVIPRASWLRWVCAMRSARSSSGASGSSSSTNMSISPLPGSGPSVPTTRPLRRSGEACGEATARQRHPELSRRGDMRGDAGCSGSGLPACPGLGDRCGCALRSSLSPRRSVRRLGSGSPCGSMCGSRPSASRPADSIVGELSTRRKGSGDSGQGDSGRLGRRRRATDSPPPPSSASATGLGGVRMRASARGVCIAGVEPAGVEKKDGVDGVAGGAGAMAGAVGRAEGAATGVTTVRRKGRTVRRLEGELFAPDERRRRKKRRCSTGLSGVGSLDGSGGGGGLAVVPSCGVGGGA